MAMNILLLIVGLIVLIVGGEALVRSAAGIALKAKLSPLVVGLTIVSVGTSAPELFASLSAALSGAPGLALGNIVGSNIANIALVLGATALINPIPVYRSMLYTDLTVMAAISLMLIVLAYDGTLSRADGIVFLVFIALYLGSIILRARRKKSAKPTTIEKEVEDFKGVSNKGYGFLIFLVILGCVGLYFGADWFVKGATGVAKQLNISNYIIGVTVVAFGTSVPELVASVIAALRRQTDISIGNLIGSNIFNIGLVLGTTSVVSPLPVNAIMLSSDLWWMLGVALLLYPLILTGYLIKRWEGMALIAVYLIYIYHSIA
jgi:cation:H+ antiporter